jgi:N-methylhydantoinase A/oxoprolinase/acetone carboxylase beta subunit
VQVASHATAIRALDVRVIGVAGGSMLRVRRGRVYGVGPRSAHIAGLPYSCFLPEDGFTDATVELIAPRPADPPDYLVIRLADGRRVALTNTCAANALGLVHDDDYARGDSGSALAAFAAAGSFLRLTPEEVARRMLQASTEAIGDLVTAVAKEHHLNRPALVAVGGGAGALGRAVASGMSLPLTVPEHAEIISAVGDALSLIRSERERTLHQPSAREIEQLVTEVEAEAVAAGASATSLDTRVEQVVERSAVRVTTVGAVGLQSGAVPGRPPATASEASSAAQDRGYVDIGTAGRFWVATRAGKDPRVAVFDQYADLVIDVHGQVAAVADPLDQIVSRHTRRVGPMTITPDVWVIVGTRITQLVDAAPATVRETVAETARDNDTAVVIIGRE